LSTSVRGWSWWKLLTWLLGTSQISRWLVRVTGADAPRVEGVAPLPRRAAHGFVSHDHTVPAVLVDLADPLDDPAPPPLTTDTHPHSGMARGGAALLPGDARACTSGVRDRITHHAKYANLCSESRVLAPPTQAIRYGTDTCQGHVILSMRTSRIVVHRGRWRRSEGYDGRMRSMPGGTAAAACAPDCCSVAISLGIRPVRRLIPRGLPFRVSAGDRLAPLGDRWHRHADGTVILSALLVRSCARPSC
jgi:hypothetical protein